MKTWERNLSNISATAAGFLLAFDGDSLRDPVGSSKTRRIVQSAQRGSVRDYMNFCRDMSAGITTFQHPHVR